MHEALIAGVLIAAGVWLWRESLRAREAATRAGRSICRANDVQLLDETVALAGMNLGWQGRPTLVRSYRFDYSVHGADRATGLVLVERGHVVHVQLAPPNRLH